MHSVWKYSSLLKNIYLCVLFSHKHKKGLTSQTLPFLCVSSEPDQQPPSAQVHLRPLHLRLPLSEHRAPLQPPDPIRGSSLLLRKPTSPSPLTPPLSTRSQTAAFLSVASAARPRSDSFKKKKKEKKKTLQTDHHLKTNRSRGQTIAHSGNPSLQHCHFDPAHQKSTLGKGKSPRHNTCQETSGVAPVSATLSRSRGWMRTDQETNTARGCYKETGVGWGVGGEIRAFFIPRFSSGLDHCSVGIMHVRQSNGSEVSSFTMSFWTSC